VDDEINVITPGANYGWPSDTGPNTNPAYADPVYTFGTTIAVTDLVFYTGSTLPFAGDLFYVDYKGDRIRRLTLSAAGDQVTGGPYDFVTNVNEPVDLEQGPDGALYYCTLNTGRVYAAQVAGGPIPGYPTESSDGGSGGCGLIGIEPFILLGVVALVRRRR
jgi:glucose/arabinose dehydrogenase